MTNFAVGWYLHIWIHNNRTLTNDIKVIVPSEKKLPARMNLDIIQSLQTVVAPDIFTPRCVYDGRKNIFAIRQLPFGDSDSREVLSLIPSAFLSPFDQPLSSSMCLCRVLVQVIVHPKSIKSAWPKLQKSIPSKIFFRYLVYKLLNLSLS